MAISKPNLEELIDVTQRSKSIKNANLMPRRLVDDGTDWPPCLKVRNSLTRYIRTYVNRLCIAEPTKHKRHGDWHQYFGCSLPELLEHIESTFIIDSEEYNGSMEWSNYGEVWEIRYIKPLKSFAFCNGGKMGEAFHFTNIKADWVVSRGNRHGGRPATAHQDKLDREATIMARAGIIIHNGGNIRPDMVI